MKKIALVAHDNKKRELVEWAKYNRDLLAHHQVYATGTTGKLLEEELGFEIAKLQSGPLGGDQQIGGWMANMIACCPITMGIEPGRCRGVNRQARSR